jgi:hypothetical protein
MGVAQRWEEEKMKVDPYEFLAQEIIKQAVKDYKKAYKKMLKDPEDPTAAGTMKEVERFILSEWFTQLTSVDAEYFFKMMKKECSNVRLEKECTRRLV